MFRCDFGSHDELTCNADEPSKATREPQGDKSHLVGRQGRSTVAGSRTPGRHDPYPKRDPKCLLAPRRRTLLATISAALATTGASAVSTGVTGRSLPTGLGRDAGTGDAAMPVLEDFSISPDGRIVAFGFSHGGPRPERGLGLFEWRTGTLTRIPNPLGQILLMPSFSYDGKRLAVVVNPTGSNPIVIGIVDLATLAVTNVIPETSGAPSFPVFQPGSDRVLYCQREFGTGLKLVGISGGHNVTILPPKNGFVYILRPSFVSVDEILFQAAGPADRKIVAELDRSGISIGADVLYRLRFGNRPDFCFRA